MVDTGETMRSGARVEAWLHGVCFEQGTWIKLSILTYVAILTCESGLPPLPGLGKKFLFSFLHVSLYKRGQKQILLFFSKKNKIGKNFVTKKFPAEPWSPQPYVKAEIWLAVKRVEYHAFGIELANVASLKTHNSLRIIG